MDSSVFGEIWELLPGWQHVGVDLPGHGGAAPLTRDDDLEGLGRRLARLTRQIGVGRVVAISFGGMIGLQLAIEEPDLEALALGSPGIAGGPRDPAAQTRNLELERLFRSRGAGPWLVERWMTSPPDIFTGARQHPELFERLRAVVSRHSWREIADGSMRGITEAVQRRADLASIRARTLVLLGEEDMPTFKRCGEILRRSIADCERRYVDGAGHLPLLERPATCAEHLERLFTAA